MNFKGIFHITPSSCQLLVQLDIEIYYVQNFTFYSVPFIWPPSLLINLLGQSVYFPLGEIVEMIRKVMAFCRESSIMVLVWKLTYKWGISCLIHVRSIPELSPLSSQLEKRVVPNHYHWGIIATNCTLFIGVLFIFYWQKEYHIDTGALIKSSTPRGTICLISTIASEGGSILLPLINQGVLFKKKQYHFVLGALFKSKKMYPFEGYH